MCIKWNTQTNLEKSRKCNNFSENYTDHTLFIERNFNKTFNRLSFLAIELAQNIFFYTRNSVIFGSN